MAGFAESGFIRTIMDKLQKALNKAGSSAEQQKLCLKKFEYGEIV